MKNSRLNGAVQTEVLTYLSKAHNKIDQRKDLDLLMTRLSPSLRNLITKHLFLNMIQEHPVFGGISEIYDFILDNIEPRQFQSEQFIIKEGQKATHMYILEQGTCEILVKGQISRKDVVVKEIG